MVKNPMNFLHDLRDRQRINIALAKGVAGRQCRSVDLKRPATWEFSGFSQNGEDGVLEVLRHQMKAENRYFLEIGAADGIENNTAWLAVAEKYAGVMIEGSPRLVERAMRSVARLNIAIECRNAFVTLENVQDLVSAVIHRDPDVLSLDIDGNDYHIAQALIAHGLRPKIIVVEYNSAFGADKRMTIEYQPQFAFSRAHPTQLYYGVSIAAWRQLLGSLDYRFATVERNGVNAFFVDPAFFDAGFLDGIVGLPFAENAYQLRKFRRPNEKQFELIKDQRFLYI